MLITELSYPSTPLRREAMTPMHARRHVRPYSSAKKTKTEWPGLQKTQKSLERIVLRFSDYSLKRTALTRRVTRERREGGG